MNFRFFGCGSSKDSRYARSHYRWRQCLIFLFLFCIILLLFYTFIKVQTHIYFIQYKHTLIPFFQKLLPEIDMIKNSQCKNPLNQWDGKFLKFQIWHNPIKSRPQHFNIHNEYLLDSKVDIHHLHKTSSLLGHNRPVIYWGSHHKTGINVKYILYWVQCKSYNCNTGTFLAKKIFSKICASMNLCCIFLSSRDSIHALNSVLHSEPINIVGHNHWIWGPKFEQMSNYRFIHFYRDPYKKIISGYRYHYDGIEEWSKKVLPFEKACAFSNSSFETVSLVYLSITLVIENYI